MVNEWDKDEADSLKGRLSATELMNIVQASKGNGILTGMDVTADSPASMNVDIAAGTFIANNVYRSYGGGSQAITAADGSNDRYDILSGKSDGTVTYTQGTAAATPLVPDLPADEILIAVIYVAAGVSVINQADICECGLCPVLPVDGDTKMQDALDMNSHRINNVTDPSADQDAATKKYVDDADTAQDAERDRMHSLEDDQSDITHYKGTHAGTPDTYKTICDLSGGAPYNLLTGVAYGGSMTRIRITVDGTATTYTGLDASEAECGQEAGDKITVISFPPIQATTSLKLELYRDSSSYNVAYSVWVKSG